MSWLADHKPCDPPTTWHLKVFCQNSLGSSELFRAWRNSLLAWPCIKPFSAPDWRLDLFGLIVHQGVCVCPQEPNNARWSPALSHPSSPCILCSPPCLPSTLWCLGWSCSKLPFQVEAKRRIGMCESQISAVIETVHKSINSDEVKKKTKPENLNLKEHTNLQEQFWWTSGSLVLCL